MPSHPFRGIQEEGVRVFAFHTRDRFGLTERSLPAGHLVTLMTERLGIPPFRIALEYVFQSKKYASWLEANVALFPEGHFVFFLEHLFHHSEYCWPFVRRLLRSLAAKPVPPKVTLHSFKMGRAEARAAMEEFPFVVAVVRTDIEYVLNEAVAKGTPPEKIGNLLWRDAPGGPVRETPDEPVSYPLADYLLGAHWNGQLARLSPSKDYLLSVLDDDEYLGADDPAHAGMEGTGAYYRPRREEVVAIVREDDGAHAALATGRGCKYKCTYCFRGARYADVRKIPLETVKKDLDWLARNGVRTVTLFDDCFVTTNLDRLRQVADLFASYPDMRFCLSLRYEVCTAETLSELARFGLGRVQIGLQSASLKTNRYMKRSFDAARFQAVVDRLKAQGAHVSVDTIVGLPEESLADFLATLDFAVSLSPSSVVVNTLYVSPGTALVEQAAGYGFKTTFDTVGERDFHVPTLVESDRWRASQLAFARHVVEKFRAARPDIFFVNR